MHLEQELTARGFINQTSADLSEILNGEKRTIYHGIDPSADSAHAGNFVQWILLRHLANAGHKIIFLVGGGTGRIGDPKPDAERTLSDVDQVDQNVAKLKKQAETILASADITFVNNNDWLSQVGLIDFLRDIGKHFTINELVKKDAIARRMQSEVGISYTEFAYPLLQAYDYLMLHRQYGCDLQTGGSDQWANIIAGVDLVRRVEQKKVYALTQALVIDKTTGKKFGKSEGNAVWLDAEKTTPYQFYQFWLQTADENVIDFLKRFTFISLREITEIEKTHQQNPGARTAQKKLATAVTTMVHGEKEAALSTEVSEILFGETAIADISLAGIELLKNQAPCFTVQSTDVLEVLVQTNLATSKREARTFVESGAVKIDGVKITDPASTITQSKQPITLLSRGKKQMVVIEW